MPETRSSRTIALQVNNSANFAKPIVPEEGELDPRQYVDPAEAAQPTTHGGQGAATDPQPFTNLRGKR